MKTIKRQRVKLFSMFAAVMMVFSLFSPTLSAQSVGKNDRNGNLHESAVNGQQLAEEKVSDRLMNEFEEDETVTFLVKFAEKADTTKAAEQAREAAESAQLSSYKKELNVRSAVVPLTVPSPSLMDATAS